MKLSEQERFWKKVRKTTACWLIGRRNVHQTFHKDDGKNVPAHRYSYESCRGIKVPKDLVVHHCCRRRNCVNPDHLQPLTTGEHGTVHAGCQQCRKPFKEPWDRWEYCSVRCENAAIRYWMDCYKDSKELADKMQAHAAFHVKVINEIREHQELRKANKEAA